MKNPNEYVIDKNITVKSYEEYQSLQMKMEDSNLAFKELVRTGKSFCAAKMGFVEIVALNHYLSRPERSYNGIGGLMFVNAGIFPPTIKDFDDFCREYLGHISHLDFFGMWVFGDEPQGVTEKEVYEKYATNSKLVCAGCWDSYHYENPWTENITGKKVLVISPFAKTIQSQFKKRKLLWSNPKILPTFELKTIKCPLSAGLLGESPYHSWVEGLKALKEEMEKTDFDVCFTSAGAWGLPLAVHAKRLGKIGVHAGGDLQLMFGIKGKRWDNNAERGGLWYNEHWVRPSDEETPKNKNHIENGCYW